MAHIFKILYIAFPSNDEAFYAVVYGTLNIIVL